MTANSERTIPPVCIYVDADACPVKKEIFRVAERHQVKVYVVANAWMSVPDNALITLVRVGDGFDAADDWIVEHATECDIVATDDILLASRCLQQGCSVLGFKGREFTHDSIGDALATREFLAQLREHGLANGGNAPFQSQDRSCFLNRLDALIHKKKRRTAQ